MTQPTHLPATVPASGGALTTTPGTQRITTRMADELLNVARSRERALAVQRRYRIGEYEFREADHAQIQRWARMLGMEAEEVVTEFQTVSAWIARAEHVNFDEQNVTTVAQFDFSFDEETYAQAKPLFITTVNAVHILEDDVACTREAMRAVIKIMMDKFGAETTANMKPYIVRFLSDVRDGSISPEELNAPDTNSRVDRNSSEPAVGDTVQDGITLAGYHIEKGARTFAAYARAMLADLGDGVKPYLKSWYMGVKYDPRATDFTGMDGAAMVESADIDALTAQEDTNAPSTDSSVERNSSEPATEPAVGDTVQDGRGTDATRDNPVSGQPSRCDGRRQLDSAGVPADGPAVDRVGGNLRLHSGDAKRYASGIATGAEFSERGSGIGNDGISVEPIAASQVDGAAEGGITKQRNLNPFHP